MDNAFKYWKSKGAELEKDYTYHAKEATCKYDASKVAAKISSYVDVPSNE
jgi:hypothetical protein